MAVVAPPLATAVQAEGAAQTAATLVAAAAAAPDELPVAPIVPYCLEAAKPA